jgi:capsular exopolysaccharide synthesis family protein
MRSNNWHSLLVTSPGPAEGKTITAANLAISLSRDVNQSVLLVDLDLHRSTVAKYLGFDIDVEAGVSDFLRENAEIPDIVYVPTEMDRIGIIPNREPIENASDLLGSPRMRELFAWLKNQAEQTIVIFDMPPVLACDDVLAICSEIDAVLMVVSQGVTDRVGLEKAMDLLQDTDMLGVVLNQSAEAGGNDAYLY